MRTRAALLRQVPGEWEVCDVELDEPRDHEVLVRLAAAGRGLIVFGPGDGA
jgi:S-(hydroxymethyl)glutathione dehydrogenase/alcohol dehydrogenase